MKVELPDGTRWSASMHTPEGIRAILDECRHEDGRSGLYFWAPGVVVVREITVEAVATLVEDLIAEGELELAFVRVGGGVGAA